MVKKANKAAAGDWHEEERAATQAEQDLEDQGIALHYAANKRSYPGWPNTDKLSQLGFHTAASKVAQAYGLLEEAEYEFRKQKDPQDYQG